MRLRRRIVYLRQRCIKRDGHKPGVVDIRESHRGSPFYTRPNFFYLVGCNRPCYLSLNPSPRIGDENWAVTNGWPCEYYAPHSGPGGPHCCSNARGDGDWVYVIGQVYAQLITNEIGQSSDIWNVILLPISRATRNIHHLTMTGDRRFYIAYAPDIWLGNTGWHDMLPVVDPQDLSGS